MLVRSKAPLRLSFAGGGTDLDAYCNLYGGFVLNATINMYAYCTIEPTDDGVIEFSAPDIGVEERFFVQERALADIKKLYLHKGVYDRIFNEFNCERGLSFKMTTFSDAPPGSGLGSSSTLVVAMIKAYAEWLNLPLGDYDIAHLAWEIERVDLGQKGGKQDQYAATFGGFNFIEFYKDDRVIVNPLRIKNWIKSELEDSIIIYYTGISRDSSKIIAQQIYNTQESIQESIEGMHQLKTNALRMKEAMLKGDFCEFISTLNEGWNAKKKTSNMITNDQIEDAYRVATYNGAKAGKVSGAGGGGFLMLYVDPIKKVKLCNALNELGGKVANITFSDHGVIGWRIG